MDDLDEFLGLLGQANVLPASKDYNVWFMVNVDKHGRWHVLMPKSKLPRHAIMIGYINRSINAHPRMELWSSRFIQSLESNFANSGDWHGAKDYFRD